MRVGGDRQDSTRSTRETATFGVLSSSPGDDDGDDEASPLFSLPLPKATEVHDHH